MTSKTIFTNIYIVKSSPLLGKSVSWLLLPLGWFSVLPQFCWCLQRENCIKQHNFIYIIILYINYFTFGWAVSWRKLVIHSKSYVKFCDSVEALRKLITLVIELDNRLYLIFHGVFIKHQVYRTVNVNLAKRHCRW